MILFLLLLLILQSSSISLALIILPTSLNHPRQYSDAIIPHAEAVSVPLKLVSYPILYRQNNETQNPHSGENEDL